MPCDKLKINGPTRLHPCIDHHWLFSSMMMRENLVTVFEDPINYNVKHPTQFTWCLWHRPAQSNWESSLNMLRSCSTVEDFWGYGACHF